MKTVCFVSYFSDEDGHVTAHWSSDKLLAWRDLGYKVILVTAPTTSQVSSKFLDVRIVRTRWSLAGWEFETRLSPFKSGNSTLIPPLFTQIFGRFFDYAFSKLAGNSESGKWFWSLSAAAEISRVLRHEDIAFTFVTGGPSGAHFGAWLASKFRSIPLVMEFQDPFIGSQFSVSPLGLSVLHAIEKAFLKKSALFVTTSRKSRDNLASRHPKYEDKILNVYPGSPHHISEVNRTQKRESHPYRLGHIGTLYDSRNFDKLLEYLGETNAKLPSTDAVQLVNLGVMTSELTQRYEGNPNIQMVASIDRKAALEFSSSLHGLLLIQHSETKSDETVPFKVYDYLNSTKPIFALIRNTELGELLNRKGCFVADMSDPYEKQLSAWFGFLDFIEAGEVARARGLDCSEQLRLITSRLKGPLAAC